MLPYNALMKRAVLVLALLVAPSLPATADTGVRPFTVASRPGTYAVGAQTQQLTVKAADGTEIFTETWLPVRKGKAVPPKRVPLVVVVTPYAFKGQPRPDRLNDKPRWTQVLVSHGYALVNVHLRGTGESGGCWGNHDRQDADDASRAIAAVAKAPWSDGRVALMGKSHDGGAALNVASRGHVPSLKAVIVLSPVASYSDFVQHDGVPYAYETLSAIDADSAMFGRTATVGTVPQVPQDYLDRGTKDPVKIAQHASCRAGEVAALNSTMGAFTPYLAEREHALNTGSIKVPVLMHYGLEEFQTPQLTGAFDAIRAPKAGVFSDSGHDYPDQNSVHPSYSRDDWEDMVIAWLDRWVLGTRNGADHWPVAQVQSRNGQWRAESGFPRTSGVKGQLALGASSVLGAKRPSGTTAVQAGQAAAWTTKVAGPLQLTGQPVLDLWTELSRPRGSIAASLVVTDPDGREVQRLTTVRSVEFLAPLRADRFVQASAVPAPVGTPVLVPLRFPPADLVVEAGQTLTVMVGQVDPSQAASDGFRADPEPLSFTVLHDCAHTSALRFTLPQAHQDVLAVTSDSSPDPEPVRALRDAGGRASARPCG